MGLFGRNRKKDEPESEKQALKEEAPPPPIDILGEQNTIVCTVRSPWQWVVERAFEERGNLSIVDKPTDLPTGATNNGQEDVCPSTPSTRRRRNKKAPAACTLRLEVQDNDSGDILEAVHGNSDAFDGLEDKDELVRTMQRCRCEHLDLSPPSRLLNWDVTKDECMNLVGTKLPILLGNESGERIAVLKEPMGSSGTGIFFVRNAEEIHAIIEEHRKRAVDEPHFLDGLIAAKGRIPSWVLQAEVHPCLLIRDRRKFHIRTYAVCTERLDTDDLVEIFVYNRHEVRIASEAVPEGESASRDRSAHITNGAYSKETTRVLLQDEPELTQRSLQEKIELFVAKALSEHLIDEIARRVSRSASQDESPDQVRKFAIAGLDIMVTEEGRLYLLEVNVNPAAPPPEAIEDGFQGHLVGFMGDLMDLVVGKPSSNFVSSRVILGRGGS